MAAGLLGCLGLAAVAQSSGSPNEEINGRSAELVTDRTVDDTASRSFSRVAPDGNGQPPPGIQSQADLAAAAEAAAKEAAAREAAAKAAAAKAAAYPKPVAGLNQKQMNNAKRIVDAGIALKLPKRAYVLAVACAMQESWLLNLASTALPESYNYPHEGTGSDHDSVGLFQQRPSSGWGTVKNLMTPAYAARQFYLALRAVPGWQNMALTYAVQAVQRSAFPDAYAKHESRAQQVVNALT